MLNWHIKPMKVVCYGKGWVKSPGMKKEILIGENVIKRCFQSTNQSKSNEQYMLWSTRSPLKLIRHLSVPFSSLIEFITASIHFLRVSTCRGCVLRSYCTKLSSASAHRNSLIQCTSVLTMKPVSVPCSLSFNVKPLIPVKEKHINIHIGCAVAVIL